MGHEKKVNVKSLPKVEEISKGDYLIIETDDSGTKILDFKNFVIDESHTTFEPLLSGLQTDITSISAQNVARGWTVVGTDTVYTLSAVGIGTTTPSEALTVNAASNTAILLEEGEVKKGYIKGGGSGLYIQSASTSTDVLIYKSDGSGANAIFKDSGNVGIGTTGPSRKLHVAGDSSANVARVRISNSHVNSSSVIDFDNDVGAAEIGVYAGASDAFQIWHGTTGASTPRMTILTDGKVGIGTDAPSHKLEVYNGKIRVLETDAEIQISDNTATGSTNGTASVRFEMGNAKAGKITAGRDDDYTGGTQTDSNLQFYTTLNNTDTERIRITSSGNVGIGTISPAEALTVAGSISARGDNTVTGTLSANTIFGRNIPGSYATTAIAVAAGLVPGEFYYSTVTGNKYVSVV